MKYTIHITFALIFIFNMTKSQVNFNRIACGSNITLHIKQGDTCGYYSNNETKGENNSKYLFEVYNNTLHIEGGTEKGGTAFISVKELRGLNISGVTKVIFDNQVKNEEMNFEFSGACKASLIIDASNLNLEASGASQLEIQGKCNEAVLEINGASKVNAKHCIFYKCNVETSGASQCQLDSITNDLKAEATGASKIYIKNIPEVYVATRSGAGRIYEGGSHDSTMQIETRIVINDGDTEDSDDDNVYHNYDGKDAGFNWAGINLGFNGLLNAENSLKAPAGYDYLDMNNASSFQFGLNLFEKDIKIYHHYVMGMVGAGFSWNNYKFTTPYVLQAYQPTLTAKKDSGKVYDINKLRVTYFNVPLLIGFNASENKKKAFHVAAGVVVGLRMGAMVKTTTVDDNGEKNRLKTFALYNTDQVRYDGMIRLKYKWANIWASYSLNGLFKKNQGPEVHPVAVGVNILEF
jgi:hypothetical protein